MRPGLRKKLLVALAAAVVAAGGAGAALWWRGQQRTELIASSLPPIPDLASWPAELRHRIESCQRRAAAGELEAFGELSRLYHANGFYAQATQCYVALAALQPGEARWPHRQAAILAGYGQAEPAIALWRHVTEEEPEYLVARLKLGDLLLKQNDLAAAAEEYRAVLARQPDEPYARFGLARCDFEAGRWEAAREQLERVVRQTNFQLGYDLIVTVYERLGQSGRAAAVRGQAMASGAYRDPPDPWLDELSEDSYDVYQLTLTAGVAERAGDVDTAIRRLERALRLAPDQPAVHFQLGTTYQNRRDVARARQHLERCTQLDPKFADAWAQWSSVLLQAGDRAGAERVLAEGLARNPNSYGLHLTRARRLREAGRLPEAIVEYQTAARLRPSSADPLVELAMTYIRTNALDRAEAELQKALVAEPEHPVALSTLVMHAVTTRDEAAARQWLERARQQPRITPERVQEMVALYERTFGRPPP